MHDSFATLLHDLPAALANTHVAASVLARLPGNRPPWQGTGIRVYRGQAYSLFARGRIQWSAQHPDRYGGPRFHLWARVAPGGRIVNLTQNTGTFIADADGEVQLGIYMGMWKNAFGDLATPVRLYERLSGEIECWAVAWRTDAAAGLSAFARHCQDAGFVTAEAARLASPSALPEGWQYLLETGHADIFAAGRTDEGLRTIALDADDDQGIVCTPVEFPLTPDTTLRWRWRAEMLASEVAEDTVHTHDYFSIATEFENGRDLTWLWSARLAPETHFHCPIRAWTARETHFVVRSGTQDLGVWRAESRNVFVDVGAAMGPPPARIVKLWLIAVTSFQHRRVRAAFAEIVLENSAGRLVVL